MTIFVVPEGAKKAAPEELSPTVQISYIQITDKLYTLHATVSEYQAKYV